MWIAPAGHAPASIIALKSLALAFIALALGQAIASWSADLVEGRRRIRLFIVCAAALYGGMNAVLQILIAGSQADIPNTANAAALAAVVAAIYSVMMRVDGADLFPVTAAAATVPSPSVAT